MKRLAAFSLMEVSFVLMIVGLLAGIVLKGQDILESAKMDCVLQEFQRLKIITLNYQTNYQTLPGDDKKAALHHGDAASNGNGNGSIDKDEYNLVWEHLHHAGFHKSNAPQKSKIGGVYIIGTNLKNLSGLWVALVGANASGDFLPPVLTPKQAQTLKLKSDEENPQEGAFYVTEGDGVSAGECIQAGKYRLDHNRPTCIILGKI
ncbi:MAG TPA: type II secretion system protein [Alphaproteobacteria bacterium]|nr:type II secretion system protein [Alphaproteobacteria bacterium]